MRTLGSMVALAMALSAFGATRAIADTQTVVTETRTTQLPASRMVVTSEAKRTFTLGDDTTHVYVAPPDVDIVGLRDKKVTVYVDPDGRVTKVTRYEERD
ncbi:MAG TPA: hypothetical protein VFD92_01385 [Candidatus Binatia bacterium]|nr:hypothetical protein [Candidatus Binatia bacterium]